MSSKTPAERAEAYTDSGVNINSGYQLVERIKSLVKNTKTSGVLTEIGGFGGLFKPDISGMENPVLVASTDGVGTKLKLACAWNYHGGIGIDLVAMSVNDILVQGARPLFFLDYFATGKLNVDLAEQVIAGIAEGCRQSSCALLGGETAEMPGMYADGEYDLAGFCVGLVDQDNIIDGSSIRVGDVLIGLGSSGIHSNGYSLVRKLLEKDPLQPDDNFPGLPSSVKETILKPTQIYAEIIRNLSREFSIKGMVHITGGGFFENIPRVLPNQLSAEIDFNSWEKGALFEWIKKTGELDWMEMLQIFNCGIGYVLIVSQEDSIEILERLSHTEYKACLLGKTVRRTDKATEQVRILF